MPANNTTIGSVRAVLGADTAQFETAMGRAQGVFANFAKTAEASSAKVANQSKVISQAGLNLSRQFTDIAVSLQGGQKPITVLSQQLPQIADALAQAKSQGVGTAAVFKGLAGSVSRFVPAIAGIGAAVGVALGGFALFERAVDKQTKGATTFGETWQATLNVVGKAISEGPIGKGFKLLGTAVGRVLDAITTGVGAFADKLVGYFGAAFQLVVKHWTQLPQVFGVLLQASANITIQALQGLINAGITGINVLLKKAGVAELGKLALPQIRIANAKIAAEYDQLSSKIGAGFKKGREGFFSKIVAETERLHKANQKAKGSAAQHAKALNDVSDAAKAAAEAYGQLIDKLNGTAGGLRGSQRDFGLTRLQKVQRDLREGLGDFAAFEGPGTKSALGEEYRQLADAAEQAAIAVERGNVQLEKTPADLQMVAGAASKIQKQLDEVGSAFEDMATSLDRVFYGVKNRDWIGAFSGLNKAIDQITFAFSSAGDQASRIGAVGATASAVGGAIGGVGGGALSGAGAGLAAGASIGSIIPGVGTVVGAGVGAVIGAIGGLFGASKAKKRAKKEAAERARQEAEQKAAEEAATHRELEIQLLELSNKGLEAQAAREADLLKTLSPANQELQKQVFALQHEADAKAAATALVALQRQQEAELADALGDATAATRLFREDAIAELPEAFRAAKRAIFDAVDAANAKAVAEQNLADITAQEAETVADARSALADTAAEEANRLEQLRDQFTKLGDDIADVLRDLRAGALAGGTSRQRLASARTAFAAVAGKTDAASLAALPGAVKDLISAEAAVAPNRQALNQAIAKAQQALLAGQAAAREQASAADLQLAALHAQTDLLTQTRDATLTVADRITNLNNALFNQQVNVARALAAFEDASAHLAAVAAIAQAATVASSLPALPAAAADTGSGSQGLAKELADQLMPALVRIVVNTGNTSQGLDDVINGGLSINVSPL